MTRFRALRTHSVEGVVESRLEELDLEDLSPGDIVIRAAFSSINYKDALAMTGAGKIMRRFPLVGGIDVAGIVEESVDDRFRPGDRVVVTGCGFSEDHDGGFSELVRAPGDWVVPLPEGLTLFDSMAIGTAGFTAALAIDRMEANGQTPGSGKIVVTGATGGVGSLAIDMLSGRGYDVVAFTGKAAARDYLKGLGAGEVMIRGEVEMGTRPLEKALWGGAIDNLGGDVLAWLTRTTKPCGNVASIGLAASHELVTTVMPFVLRGVNLLGINSSYVSRDYRVATWRRLATDVKPRRLETIARRTVALDELMPVFDEYIQGAVTGRTVVRIGGHVSR